MTPRQFWQGDPWLAEDYRRADEITKRRQNETLWLQGLYVYDAFSAVMANAFRKKGARAVKYAEKPYDVGRKTPEEKEAAMKAEQERIRQRFEAMRKNWIATHKTEDGEKQ